MTNIKSLPTLALLVVCYGCGNCVNPFLPIRDDRDYDTRLAELRVDAMSEDVFLPSYFVAGVCEGGDVLFIRWVEIDYGAATYYDTESRLPIARSRISSFLYPCVETFMPRRVDCGDFVIVEHIGADPPDDDENEEEQHEVE